MTYWYLAGAAALLLVAALAIFLATDAFDSGSDMVDFAALVLSILCAMGCMCTTVGFITSNLDRSSCLESGRKTGMTVSYEMLSGCYVTVDGRRIPYDKWVQVSGVNTP